ncbi:MAG: polysaccharide deacetylase family protein [bacterium]
MIIQKQNNIAIFLILSLSLLFGFFYFKSEGELQAARNSEQFEIAKHKSLFSSIKALATNNPLDNSSSKKVSNKTNINNLVNIDKNSFQFPILLYHYIRDYNDANDQLGVNLSVSPTVFGQQLDQIVKKGYQTITFNDILNNSTTPKPIMLTFDDGYEDFYTNAFPELKKRNMKAVIYVITNPPSYGNYLTKAQIKEISDYGIEIGSHTLTHPNLSTVSEAKAQNEISESKIYLENIIHKPIISFCYPSGKYNSQTINLVSKSNYIFAVTTEHALGSLKKPFEISRYKIGNNPNLLTYLGLK